MSRKRLRVLQVSPAHPAGDPRIVYKQAPALVGRYEVSCALPGADATQSGSISFISLPSYRRLWTRLLLCHPVICWHILRTRPAILHIYMPELLPIAFLCWLTGIRVIYEVQENLYKKFSIKTTNNDSLSQLLFRWFDRQARLHFPLIFTEHRYREEYTNLKCPHEIIYNFPDLMAMDHYRKPYCSTAERYPELVYIGVVSMERALDTIIQAVSQLKAFYPTIRVHLFGRCTIEPEQLKRLPDYEEAKNHLIFYGHTSHRQALPYATRCVAGLALLKPVGDYPDSYPTKLFEYMALGLPVITSNFPLYQEIVDEHRCGFCINPVDSATLAQRIRFLIDNPKEAEAMGKRGRQAIEKQFNWPLEAKKLVRFYQLVENK